MNKYTVKIYESEDLQGLTGENGERFCVLIRNNANPLCSTWIWTATQEGAKSISSDMTRLYPSPA